MSECNSVDLTHYKNDKERLRRQARDKYSNLSEEEKTKRETICLKKEKQILKEYPKNYCEAEKSQYNKFYLYTIKPIYSCHLRWTEGNKSLIMHD